MSGIPAGAGSLLGKRLGKYEILALLALGGTAEIYLARIGGHAGFEKYVVVKCLHDHLADDSDFVKMFLDEARLAAQLDHSNIVQTFELGEHENRYYMVMEFLAGLSLSMVVRRAAERLAGGRIPVPLVLNIAAQSCAGLHYAHERNSNGKPLNVVHRDISPQNLVISFEGVVKVVDFGIARAEMRETKTKAGTIKGKFSYMSPEQCIANNVDRRTDVFALGVIVWELLTGRRLFKRNSPYDTYQAVIECAVPVPSKLNHELDPALDEIVMKAVAKDSEQRYPTAEAFGDALQKYLHHRGKGSGPAEIGRFFDQHCAQDIEEHGERMRELISGRDPAVEAAATWSAEDEERKASQAAQRRTRTNSDQTVAERAVIELTGSDLVGHQVGRNSNTVLPAGIIDDALDPDGDADELPVERTRIEQNPLEQLKQLNDVSGVHTPLVVPYDSLSDAPPLPAAPPVAGRGGDRSSMTTQIAGVDPSRQNETPPRSFAPQLSSASPYPVVSGRPTSAELAPSTYPVMSGRPLSADLAPSNPPPTQQSPYSRASRGFDAVRPQPRPPPSGPQHAADTVSPVGDQYPRVDWAVAAGQVSKPLPRWALGVLFGGALFIALLVTILIAKLFR